MKLGELSFGGTTAALLGAALLLVHATPGHAQLPTVSAAQELDLSDLTDPFEPTVVIPTPNVYFGSSVAIDGDYAIVAGLRPSGDGRAYLYTRDFLSGWKRSSRLDEDAALTDLKGFGAVVSMGGGTGAILQRKSTGVTTAVHIFSANVGWALEDKITDADFPIAKVTALSAWGDTVALGDEKAEDSRTGIACGRVAIFTRTPTGWTLQAHIAPSDPIAGVRFGSAVALDGDRLLIGAPGATIGSAPRRGICYVFERRERVWHQTARFTDPSGEGYQDFGSTVALSGNAALVGSPGRALGNGKGTVAAFQWQTNNTWKYEGLLPLPKADRDPAAPPPQFFGSRVSLSGSMAAIGTAYYSVSARVAPERSYLYQRRGDRWQQLTPVDGPLDLSAPGGAVALSGNRCLVGAAMETSAGGARSGVVRSYDLTSGLAVFDGPSIASPELTDSSSTPTIDLGDLLVGRKVTRSFTIQNTGFSSLDNVSIYSDGVDGEGIVLPTITSLPIGSAITFTLSVTPPAEGAWQTHVVVDGEGEPSAHMEITLTANGVAATEAPYVVVATGSQLVWDESPVEFTVEAGGTRAIGYQWFKNDRALPGETGRVLRLPSARATHAGAYKAKITNAAGNATSTVANLAIYEVKPDTALRVNDGAAFTLTAPVTGPGVRYQWRFNNVVLTDSAPISGTTTAQLKVSASAPALAGLYSVTLNPGASQVTPQRWNLTVLQRPQIQNATNFLASLSVASSVTGRINTTPAATSFRFGNVPPGITVDARYGSLSGKPTVPGVYAMTVSATNAAGTGSAKTFAITVAPIDNRAIGAYRGTIARHNATGLLGGAVQLNASATGQCTGTLLTGKRTVRFTTTLFQTGDATAYLVDVDASLPGAPEVYTLRINMATGRLTGTVTLDPTIDPLAVVTGWINPWSTANPSSLWSDYCTATITPPTVITDVSHTPVGTSYTTLSIGATGNVTWSGRMADGSVTTLATSLSPTLAVTGGIDGVEIPVFLLPANGTSSVLGTAKLNQSDFNLPNYHAIGGTLDWFKVAEATTSKNRNYKDGIVRHNLILKGSGYLAPSQGLPVLDFPFALFNAQLTVTGAGFETAEQAIFMEEPFTISGNANAIMPVPNTLIRTLTIDRARGTFTGTFTLNDPGQLNPAARVTRKTSFYGVLLTSGTGEGFVSLPALPDVFATPATTASTSPINAAKLRLLPVNTP